MYVWSYEYVVSLIFTVLSQKRCKCSKVEDIKSKRDASLALFVILWGFLDPVLSQIRPQGTWSKRPRTLLIDLDGFDNFSYVVVPFLARRLSFSKQQFLWWKLFKIKSIEVRKGSSFLSNNEANLAPNISSETDLIASFSFAWSITIAKGRQLSLVPY